jgi:hypothetical protein
VYVSKLLHRTSIIDPAALFRCRNLMRKASCGVPQRVRYWTENQPYEIKGLRIHQGQSHKNGMKYGYARVSTEDQNPAMQLAALKKAG